MDHEYKFERVIYDHEAESYLDSSGNPVTFTNFVCVRFPYGDTIQKLAYTRAVDGLKTSKAVPCLKGEAGKLLLDHPDLEIASQCLIRG